VNEPRYGDDLLLSIRKDTRLVSGLAHRATGRIGLPNMKQAGSLVNGDLLGGGSEHPLR
jgi:hypothetical protein